MHVPFPQPAQLIKPENSDLGRQFSRKIELSKNDQKLDFYEGDNLFVKNFAVAAKTRQLPTIGSLHFTDGLRFGRVVFEKKKLKTIKKVKKENIPRAITFRPKKQVRAVTR